MIAGSLRIKVEEKQELLEERNVTKRLRRLSEILARELEVMELGSKIQSEVQSEMDKTQREYFLREQLKAIQQELGEEDETQAEINELREQMDEAGLPEDVRKQAERELSRLEKLPPAAAEHGVIRTYLEWIVSPALEQDAPRTTSTSPTRARSLDADHYDIEKVKERILDHLAVRKLKPDARGSILSLRRPARRRQDVARQVDRARRSGASSSASRSAACATRPRSAATAAPTSARCPGTIIRALRDAESNNPVFMIDEIDKMGTDFRGDPGERDARGARPRAEPRASATTTSTCRSTSRT